MAILFCIKKLCHALRICTRSAYHAYHYRIGLFGVSGDDIDFESHIGQFAMLLLL